DAAAGEGDLGDDPAPRPGLGDLGLEGVPLDGLRLQVRILQEQLERDDDRAGLPGANPLDLQHQLDHVAARRVLLQGGRPDDAWDVHGPTPADHLGLDPRALARGPPTAGRCNGPPRVLWFPSRGDSPGATANEFDTRDLPPAAGADRPGAWPVRLREARPR